MSNKPVLFYSPNCQHSINLWKKLKQQNLLNSIVKINVHNVKKIPQNVKSVPTLVVSGRAPLEGQAIEFYFNSFSNNNHVSSRPEASSLVNSTQHTSQSGQISDFFPCEMGNSWSDDYSFIDNDKPLNHRYSFIGNANSGIPTKNEIAKISSGNGSNSVANRLEELKKARSMDMKRH